MGSVLSRSGPGSRQGLPAAFKTPGSTCSSNVPPICDPHQIKVGSAAGWQTCPRPPSRAAVWTWRCGDRRVPLAVLAPQPTRYGTHRRPGPRTRRREWGCSILLPAAKFKSSGSPCRPNNRRRSGMASTSTFPHVVNARFQAGGSRPSHGPATDAMTTEGASRLVARRILPCSTPRRSFSSPFRCCQSLVFSSQHEGHHSRRRPPGGRC